MAKQYNFRKTSHNTFKTKIDVFGKTYDVSVHKNGTRWNAKAEGFCSSSGDTKRFAVVHLEKAMKFQAK
ncbi:hypothetical protein PBI_SCTP2_248 [Salicola phage SCTP-2]|nr:hypothetical protein PBI_SCTP2_248 [Salicola phage SCTP-2]